MMDPLGPIFSKIGSIGVDELIILGTSFLSSFIDMHVHETVSE